MKVYLLETGVYENRGVSGIFDTPERAMAAHHPERPAIWKKTTWTSFPNWPDRSLVRHWVSWTNNHDGDYAAEVLEYELVADGPERGVDAAVVQTYRESDGGWEYLPEPVASE